MAATVRDQWEYSLRENLLLLATLVASVTYSAGFNPPGGVWQDTTAGHLAGDPIIRDIRYVRYAVFYYCNASAFASSLVVIVLMLLLLAVAREDKQIHHLPAAAPEENQKVFITFLPLRVVMVLDLLSLMMAYAAGTCRDTFTKVYSSVLVSAVFTYVIFQVGQPYIIHDEQLGSGSDEVVPKQLRKVLMTLATFAVSVTYVAGLSTPGGFWDNTEGGHRPGDAILKDRHNGRLTAFFVCNTTAFVASLLIIVQLLGRRFRKETRTSPYVLYGCIMLALTSLVGAYAAGSCRETGSTAYVLGLVGAVVVCILIQLNLSVGKADTRSDTAEIERAQSAPAILEHTNGSPTEINRGVSWTEKKGEDDQLKQARDLVLLLATLAATITYQAGLDPPGGFWEDNGQGHRAGDPILLTTNPRRYKAFFYCNSVAFVASLVAIVLVKAELFLKCHALEAAMILDLFGLIGAYAAGTCRDVSASIYVMALAGAVLVYVVIHVIFFTLDHKDNNDDDKELEKRRKRLLLFSILAATITYQAGLTPPGGFLLRDDKPFGGHHHQAGDPVLLYNSTKRYTAFFYCNSVSFMLSIALIILLVNPNLYKPAIRSYALSVCTAAGLLSLMGAYAAGSTQHLSTTICIIVLVAVVSVVILLLLLVTFVKGKAPTQSETVERGREEEKKEATQSETVERGREEEKNEATQSETVEKGREEEKEEAKQSEIVEKGCEEEKKEATQSETVEKGREKEKEATQSVTSEKGLKKEKIHAKREYLMLLGILVASVTYQAGLDPPGGFWQSSRDGHNAGHPVMYDNRRRRYRAFFYCNSTSFVASIAVIVLLLVQWVKDKDRDSRWFKVMTTTIVLDLLALLGAYAAGSSRAQKTSWNVVALIAAVLAYFAIHVMLAQPSSSNAHSNSQLQQHNGVSSSQNQSQV